MQGENMERWRELCALAATEQDSDRLLALIREINTLLERKERRLKSVVASQICDWSEPKVTLNRKPA